MNQERLVTWQSHREHCPKRHAVLTQYSGSAGPTAQPESRLQLSKTSRNRKETNAVPVGATIGFGLSLVLEPQDRTASTTILVRVTYWHVVQFAKFKVFASVSHPWTAISECNESGWLRGHQVWASRVQI